MRRISFFLAILLILAGSSIAGATATGISGTVTDSATHAAISGMTIKAYATPAGYIAGTATTDASGNYTITGTNVTAGNYIVFADASNGYLIQYWDHTSDYKSATPVTVTSGNVTPNINFSLQKAGSISGNVKDGSTNAVLSGMTVSACPTTSGNCTLATTDGSGNYTMSLPTGSFYVSSGGSSGYVTQYYNDVYDQASATPVDVTAGGSQTGINFALLGAGSISGNVKNGSTNLPNMAVKACPTAGGGCYQAITDASGNYTLPSVLAGSYYVSAGGTGTNYFIQYYNNVSDQASATPVTVTSGNTSASINFLLVKAGSISGTVTNSSTGAALPGMTVNACPTAGGNCYAAFTDSSGNYSILGLPTGSFYVNVDTIGTYYIEQYYNNAPDVSSATSVTVNVGNNTAGINFAMKIAPAKIGVFDPSTGNWYIDSNMNWTWDGTAGGDKQYTFGAGLPGAVPVVGDWNGNGTAKIGVYSNGTWYLDLNGDGVWDTGDVKYTFGAGLSGAVPVVGDWNGNGTTKIGVYSNGTWYLDLNGDGVWDTGDIEYTFGAGLSGAVPVVGDWNGNGKTKIGIYQNGNWYLDTNGNGQWDGQSGGDTLGAFGTGLPNAVPVTGDWNADGITEIGIYQQGGYWYLDKNRNWQWDGNTIDQYGVFGYGMSGAIPVPGRW